MAPPSECPDCAIPLVLGPVVRCPQCRRTWKGTTQGPKASGTPRRKSKKPKSSWVERNLTLVIGGSVGLGLLVVLGLWLVISAWTRKGGGGGGDGVARVDEAGTAIVDDIPDPPAPKEPPDFQPAGKDSPKTPTRTAWKGRPDPKEKPDDLSSAFGMMGPSHEFLLASGTRAFAIGYHSHEPERRMVSLRTKEPGTPFKQVSWAGKPFPVVDLNTGKPAGEFLVPNVMRFDRLSPDGRSLAGLDRKLDTGFFRYTNEFCVWATDKDKPIHRWTLPDHLVWFDFLTPTRIAAWIGGAKPRLVLLDVGKAEPIREVALPTTTDTPPPGTRPHFYSPIMVTGTVSPGGKYLALADTQRVNILQTADGQLVGQLPFGAKLARDAIRAVAFDETGDELRVVTLSPVRPNSNFHVDLRCWSMADGQLVCKTSFELPNLYYNNLISGPKPGTVILGHYVLDLDTGTLLDTWQFQPFAWCGPKAVLAVGGVNLAPNKDKLTESVEFQSVYALAPMPFDKEAFEKKAVASRAKAQDKAPLPLTKFDRTRLARVSLEPPERWAVPPSPTVDLPKTLTLPHWPNAVTATEAVVLEGVASWTRHDLKTGEPIGKPIALSPRANPNPLLIALRGRDSLLAAADTKMPSRLDVWDRDGKHVVGLRPSGEEKVAWLGWSNQGLLLTLVGQRLVGWDVDRKAAVFEVDAEFPRVQLSPGGHWLVGASSTGALHFLDAERGTCLGRIVVPVQARVSISPDGKTMLMEHAVPAGLDLIVWDLATGRRSAVPEMARMGVLGHWVNSRRLLSPGPKMQHALYDLDLHTHSYLYDLGPAPEFRSDVLGRGWMNQGKAEAPSWGPIQVPGADGVGAEVVFGRGSTIRVEINVGNRAFNPRIARTTAQSLQRRGCKIGKNAWCLKAEHVVGSASRKLDNPRTGASYTVSVPTVEITWSLLAPDGTVVWTGKASGTFDPFRSRYVKPGSRKRDGSPLGGGYESVELDYDGKDPRTAQVEEIIENLTMSHPNGPVTLPAVVVKTAKGYELCPRKAKLEVPLGK